MDSSLSKIEPLADKLVHWFQPDHSYVVALSGGVDSATVACAGKLSAANVFTATGVGPATSQQERRDAQTVVETLDIEHFWIEPEEHLSPDYQRNDLRRCFHCKTHLFTALATRFPQAIIITGTNFDDLSDYRPGLEAARNADVRAPLAELEIGKAQVRQLASHWNLHIADKPASPCLASRIAYGLKSPWSDLQKWKRPSPTSSNRWASAIVVSESIMTNWLVSKSQQRRLRSSLKLTERMT